MPPVVRTRTFGVSICSVWAIADPWRKTKTTKLQQADIKFSDNLVYSMRNTPASIQALLTLKSAGQDFYAPLFFAGLDSGFQSRYFR